MPSGTSMARVTPEAPCRIAPRPIDGGHVQVAFDGDGRRPQFAAGREHAVDDDAGRAHPFGCGYLDPLARLVQPAEVRFLGDQLVEQPRGADVREFAVEHRAPERLPAQDGVHFAQDRVLVLAQLPLPGEGHGEMPVQVEERHGFARRMAKLGQASGNVRIEADEPAIHRHQAAGQDSAGRGHFGSGRLLQERINPPAPIGDVDAVLGTHLHRLPQCRPRSLRDATSRAPSVSNVSTTSPDATTRPEGRHRTQVEESARNSSNTVLMSPQGVLTGSAPNSLPESEYCGRRRESPPEWIINTRVSVPARFEFRPEHAESVQGGAAAADTPVARIGYGEVQRFGNRALMLPASGSPPCTVRPAARSSP